jgi:hypothetical protein
MLGAPVYKLWEARLQELSGYVQRYPAVERHGPSPLIQVIGRAAAPSGGAANTTTCRAAAGLSLASPAQPTTTPPRPATPVVARGQPVLMMEIPAPAKAGVAVVTLRPREESRGTTVRRQQHRHGSAQEVQTPSGVAPVATKKRASKCSPDKPLVVGPGPVAAAGSRARGGASIGVTLEPTPRKWCPFHETSLHDVTACRHIGHLVEIRRECLAKRAAKGVTHGCHECGQDGHWSCSCPGNVPPSEGLGSSEGGLVGAWPGHDACRGLSGMVP